MSEPFMADRLCPKCGQNDCFAQNWGDGDLRICCNHCGHCWIEESASPGRGGFEV